MGGVRRHVASLVIGVDGQVQPEHLIEAVGEGTALGSVGVGAEAEQAKGQ